MIQKREGKIINTLSISGLQGTGPVHYVSFKAVMIGFTMVLARELVGFNITVNAVAPGLISTDILPPIAVAE
jgi:3-oxoacyl-[acyl-carrier protein] reductase